MASAKKAARKTVTKPTRSGRASRPQSSTRGEVRERGPDTGGGKLRPGAAKR